MSTIIYSELERKQHSDASQIPPIQSSIYLHVVRTITRVMNRSPEVEVSTSMVTTLMSADTVSMSVKDLG